MSSNFDDKFRAVEKYLHKLENKVQELREAVDSEKLRQPASDASSRVVNKSSAAVEERNFSRVGSVVNHRAPIPPTPADDRASILSTVSVSQVTPKRRSPVPVTMNKWGDNLSYVSTNLAPDQDDRHGRSSRD
jgi:hypothetical protein